MKNKITKAMLLAAGLGTRMRPLTDKIPKPLIEVCNKTLLEYNIEELIRAGIEEVVINVHYRSSQIIDHLKNYNRIKIIFSHEEKLLDSGGGIKKVIDFFGNEPFFTLNADTIWLDGPKNNITSMMEYFDAYNMDALLLLAKTTTTIGWGNRGDFMMDQNGKIKRPTYAEISPFAYTGAAILKPEYFLEREELFSLNQIFNDAIAKERLHGINLEGIFMHIGTPQAKEKAEKFLKNK